MTELRTKTEENLYAAFVGEAKAHLRLMGYADKADQEGYPQMAKLFRAIAAAEKIHGVKHLKLLKVISSTEENLQRSFESETSVSENIYPEFIKQAEADGNRAALTSFSHARDAEEVHAKLYKKAIGHMVDETEPVFFVCNVCGYVVEGDPPDTCPVCGAKKERFFRVD